jgi:hypothetical protein
MYDHLNVPSPPDPAREAAIEAAYLSAKEFAHKHGYYYSVLPDNEKPQYKLALEEKGFEQEIALVKTKMWSVNFLFPFNHALIVRFITLFERLSKAQANLEKKAESLKAPKALDQMFAGLGLPSGMMAPHLGASPGTA